MPVFSNIVAIPFSFNCQKQDYTIPFGGTARKQSVPVCFVHKKAIFVHSCTLYGIVFLLKMAYNYVG